MASVNWRKRGKRYLVYWRADDGSQGGKTVDTEDQARLLAAQMLLELTSGTWTARQRAKLPLAHWDAEWWQVWSAAPDRSPTTLAATESRRRLHVLPQLGRRPLEATTPRVLRQWQDQLAGKVGYETVMACRSIAFRILKFAEDEGAIPANPMRKVPAPDPPVDPDQILGDGRRRAYTPVEAGQLLAYFPRFWWDHVITLLGTGMRFGEFAGLHKRRALLDRRPFPIVQVVDTRYQAGRFGSGFKPWPKSRASVREIPLARQVAEAIRRQLPPGAGPDTLVFAGPGGGNGVQAGTHTVLSRDNFRRIYHAALAKLADPGAIDLRPTARRVLATLRADGPATAEELTNRLGGRGRRLKLATVQAAARELEAVGLALADGGESARWKAQPPPGNDMLDELELHGPHDFRHTLSTWLEEAGIPARIIDEIMGHQSGQTSRSPRDSGSRVGTRYRHTTPEMAARAVAAIEERLALVLKVAEEQVRRQSLGAASVAAENRRR